MTAKVKEWYGNSSVLRKIVMKIPNEHEARYKRFTSTEGPTAANRPKLVVTYNSAPNAPAKPGISWAKRDEGQHQRNLERGIRRDGV